MRDGKAIGKSVGRVEGHAKVTGSCLYTADVLRPDGLWAGFVRSPLPHARILNIDTSGAKRLPGIQAIITGRDVSSRLEGKGLEDKSILAQDRVRYIGEKVAAVAGTDRDVVEEALSLIRVDYEELPTVFDPLEAIKPDAITLHPNYAAYNGLKKEPSLRNVQSVERSLKGDLERGFAESDEIFEATYTTHMAHQGFIEPRACVVDVDRQGRLAVWGTNQQSFILRDRLVSHTDLPAEMISVEPVTLGGSFGGKSGYEEAMCAYYLARASGKPIKFVGSYAEEFIDGEPRHASIVTLRTGVKKDGRLWAWAAKIYYNGGAYGAKRPLNSLPGSFMLGGSYRTPNVSIEAYIIYTNQVPCGFFRGPGEVQALFAVESHMDEIAEALGIDPLELRFLNSVREGDTMPSGSGTRDPHGVEVLKNVAALSRWKASRPRSARNGAKTLFGRGLAFGDRQTGIGESSAELVLEKDGSVRVLTSVRDQGAGAYTMHRQVAAEALGINVERIRVDVRGTDGPFDGGVKAARGTHIEGLAVLQAAHALVETMKGSVARTWGVPLDEITWDKGKARLKGSKRAASLEEIASLSPNDDLRGVSSYGAGMSRPEYHSFQAIVADVEVNAETGEVRLKRLYFTYDITQMINPVIHQGQIDGAMVQGLGFPLIEQLEVEEGRLKTVNFGDYKIPTIWDIPILKTSLVHSKEGPGPFGAKSVGEAGIAIVAPAIANAVYNATGIRFRHLPITPEKILKGLRALGDAPRSR
jgi:CO/xanthine dehydrogenase Mo-binding subunit